MPITKENLSAKKDALAEIRHLPESASYSEIIEAISILASIRAGEAAIAEGRVHTHEEAVEKSLTWIAK